MTDQPRTTHFTLDQAALLIANLFRAEPNDHVITIGDWQPHPVEGQPEIFCGAVRFTVGDFRRWAPGYTPGVTTTGAATTAPAGGAATTAAGFEP